MSCDKCGTVSYYLPRQCFSNPEAVINYHIISPDPVHMKKTIVCLNDCNPSSLLPPSLLPSLPPPPPPPTSLTQSRGNLTFVWTMPALWSLKCSRVAAISISLAPATDRKLDWVQSSGVIQLTSVNLSLYWAPFGTAQRLKIITFIPRKTWTRATDCFSIKYARGYFSGVWEMCNNAFKKH